MMPLDPNRILIYLIPGLLLASARASADEASLSLADLEAYRVALASKSDDTAPLVRFRDLWDRPEAYVGHEVRVEGRVARVFRQARLGEFPPLVEAWVVSPTGDPFCLVFPQVEDRSTPEIGSSVGFSGTFLKRVKYQGGDTARVAPLIVGPRAPYLLTSSSKTEGASWSSTDWLMALGGLAIVSLFLARRHFAHPVSPPMDIDPPPTFIDGNAEPDRDEAEESEGYPHEDKH